MNNRQKQIFEKLVPGTVIEFEYPAANYHLVPERLEVRRGRVEKVRDIFAERLEPETFSKNPLLRRDRYLFELYDFDRDELRHFYFNSMHEVRFSQGDDYCVAVTGQFTSSCVGWNLSDIEAEALADSIDAELRRNGETGMHAEVVPAGVGVDQPLSSIA